MNETLRLVITIIQLIVCGLVIVTVLFQSSKQDGLGASFGGSSETFFGKNKGRSLDAKLARLTSVFACLFIVLTFILAVF